MDPVVHFEMSAEDKKRVSEFYSKVFGWKMAQMGPDMGDYILAGTTKTDDKGMVQTPGNINGGFYQRKPEGAPIENAPHLVIAVQNLEESMKKVESSGGKLIDKPMDIPTVGKFIVILDSEGNRVGMLQPAAM